MEAQLLDRLEQEHRTVEDLLSRLESATTADQQRPLVEELGAALREHMQVEETQVYPEMAKIDGEIAEEAEIEHGLARTGLQQLEQLIGQPGFAAAVAMLQAGIEHHVEDEEGEAFPKLRKALGLPGRSGGAGNAEMTRDELYEQAKEQGIEGRSSMSKDELAAAVHHDRS